MTSLNELAIRHGLSPLDISAAYYPGGDNSKLVFYTLPQESVPLDKVERMLAGLGIDEQSMHIEGTPQQIYDTIHWAIEKAPRRVR